ncbi:MAG: hypothetical protein AB8B64_20600 [Granulosicoccus sp.]
MDTSLTASRVIETDRTVVEAELSRLLSEKKFAGAPQMSSFLSYIVTQTLDGKGDRIKAYTVGVDALGKPYTFDAQSDPSVRVLALRLRKTLASIYESEEQCHAQIVLKVGTYVPEFLETPSSCSALDQPSSLQSTGNNESPKRDSVSASTAARVLPESVEGSVSRVFSKSATVRPPANPMICFKSASMRGMANAALNDPRRVLVFSTLFIFFCFWLLTAKNNTTYLQKLSAGIPLPLVSSNGSEVIANSSFTTMQQIPTLYLVDDDKQSQRLRQVSILMGSSVVQSGSLNVVRVSPTKVPAVPTQGDYHMVLNELLVDSQARIEAQILRLQSGIVVSSSTLFFDNTTSGFSTEEILQVEGLARQIADAAGSLYMDFCVVQEGSTPVGCSFDQAESLVIAESDAV